MANDKLEESNSLRLIGLTFSTDLKWNNYIKSFAKSFARKVGPLCCSRQFFSPESTFHIDKSTVRLCIEYCYRIWSGGSDYLYQGILEKNPKNNLQGYQS